MNDSRDYMISTVGWKYVYFNGFPSQLLDLENDPNEFFDLGKTDSDKEVFLTSNVCYMTD
ncbi:hypothetical protein [Neptunomonas sp.]|uniref:hypothetical protein n=1 Tax=Neptunomonas sp. TaxID=1971898 RepID=UPI0035681DE8